MNVYGVTLDVRFKEYGVKRPVQKELRLWVLEAGSLEKAIKKAKAHAMKRSVWDMGYPLSVKLTAAEKAGTIDVR